MDKFNQFKMLCEKIEEMEAILKGMREEVEYLGDIAGLRLRLDNQMEGFGVRGNRVIEQLNIKYTEELADWDVWQKISGFQGIGKKTIIEIASGAVYYLVEEIRKLRKIKDNEKQGVKNND